MRNRFLASTYPALMDINMAVSYKHLRIGFILHHGVCHRYIVDCVGIGQSIGVGIFQHQIIRAVRSGLKMADDLLQRLQTALALTAFIVAEQVVGNIVEEMCIRDSLYGGAGLCHFHFLSAA